ncbi:MAG TPA: hypothetical protein VF131_16325 [Blastocatellia bacterium]|nr:hypothetical protein [Blastocatellia bacterium]
MKVSKSSALKLLFIIAAVSVYTFVGFADSSKYSEPQTSSADTNAAEPDSDKDASNKEASKKSTAAQTEPRPVRSAGLFGLTAEDAQRRSAGCLDCHNGIEDMHSGVIYLGCIDCHGGKADVRAQGLSKGSPQYQDAKKNAHVQPRFPEEWKTSANPERTYTLLLKESAEFIQFINPGDLRVAGKSCGTAECHQGDVHNVRKSMMTTGAMLWGAALYNNGAFPLKNYRFGESYSPEGAPQRVQTNPPPTAEQTQKKGILPYLDPLPRWEISQISNILRTFELGGRKAAEIGLPQPFEPPGKPTQNLLSPRGLGTNLRTDPVYIGLQKTRLLDPMLSLLGTNDQPGDYRSSGCTACHVPYANNRDPFEAGPWGQFGHTGLSASADQAIPKDEPGHPIKHQFTRSIPSSQCVVCHMHPGTLVLNSYFGSTWWDLETDGDLMYPKVEKILSAEERREIIIRNPEESALRGKWGDREFLKKLRDEINPQLKHTQFADFNGHGWVYRYVFAKDRKGNLLDASGKIVGEVTNSVLQRAIKEPTDKPETREGVPVHLKDIHIEKGMHCVDCHFKQDNHGDGNLYGEVRNAIEIDCIDCHGSITKRADPTSRDARTTAAAGGNRMLDYRNLPSRKDRFFKRDGKLFQRAAVAQDKDGKPLVWEVKQVMDTVTAGNEHYNEKAALAKTILKDGKNWGNTAVSEENLAHANRSMTCFACHTSWTPSCFGCHLKQQANQQKPMLHNEGSENLRNYTSYNFQTLRDDVFMLGKDGTVTGRRFAPVRSACAVVVSSQNAQREWIYSQQQTVSAEGYSGVSFSSHFPHTVRTRETRGCTDCHLSENNDNNAYMAMALMQGTNFYNFLGRFVYVGVEAEGFEAVVVTERDEPQAVIGSYLHKLAYPENYKKHELALKKLKEFYEHPGNDIINALNPFKRKERTEVLSLTLRGEFLYAATGEGGLRVYDVANIDQKGFSERMTTAPFSPLGQRLYVKTKFATAVASPATIAVDPTRKHYPENEEAQNRDDKQAIPLVYAFLYVTDREEGFIVVGNPLDDKNGPGVATLLDGNPRNNFIQRAVTFNPDGKLKGANNVVIAGTYAYVTADRGLFIIDLADPLKPRIVSEIGEPFLKKPRAVQVQFRYAFVCDEEGVKVIDVTNPAAARAVRGEKAVIPVKDAHNLYLVRTYAYVAAGKDGLVIIDIEKPEEPKFVEAYNSKGKIIDARDVKVGMTNVSLFAYVADGEGRALHVIQLTSPEKTPGNYGFSPKPKPELIATKALLGPALAVSEGTDRDRAVDENGYQLAVFGRRGARPLNGAEMQRMYMKDGKLFTVPEIKDGNIKENADIRRRYGRPGQPDTASEEQLKQEQKKTDEPKKSASLEAPSGYSLSAELIGVAILFLPFVATLHRWRRGGRRK